MAEISCKREQCGVYSGYAERSRNCASREYSINKGIGRSVEYKGLKAQYLFIFAGGLLGMFVVFVIMYVIGISQWFCIGFGITVTSILVWLTFHLNAKYGQYGLMKLAAVKYHPRYIINRLRLNRLIKGRK